MLSENKENLNPMQEKAKDIDITFYPQLGIGRIMFNFQEKDIINVLGIYDNKELDKFEDSTSVIRLYYPNLMFSINYSGEQFNYLSIFSDDLILENVCFSNLMKSDLLSFIESYHIRHSLQFECGISFDKDLNESCFL